MSRKAPKPASPWPPWPRCTCGGPALPHGAPAFLVNFAVETANEANSSGAQRWQKIHRRERAREATTTALALALMQQQLPAQGPWCVRLTRVSPLRLDDDAVPLALKTIRDTIAAALGVDDGSPSIGFLYGQEKGRPLGVRVEVWGGAGATDPALRGGG